MRGGKRQGAGAPKKEKKRASITVRVSPEAHEIFLSIPLGDRGKWIDQLILQTQLIKFGGAKFDEEIEKFINENFMDLL